MSAFSDHAQQRRMKTDSSVASTSSVKPRGRLRDLKILIDFGVSLPSLISFSTFANTSSSLAKVLFGLQVTQLTWIFLSENLGQANGVVNRRIPGGCIECKFGGLSIVGHRW